MPSEANAFTLSEGQLNELKSYMIDETKILKRLRYIMMFFAVFEFGLVVFSVIAICNVDLKSTIIEYYGPTLTAVLVLTS